MERGKDLSMTWPSVNSCAIALSSRCRRVIAAASGDSPSVCPPDSAVSALDAIHQGQCGANQSHYAVIPLNQTISKRGV
jgi:hypothetical protein